MFLSSLLCASLTLFLILTQETEFHIAESMVRNLGSSTYSERVAADSWLRQRPNTIFLLQKAVKSPSLSLEVKRRVVDILNYYEQVNFKKLKNAMRTGEIEDVIDLLSKWPQGKYEDEVWRECCLLTNRILRLNRRQKGIERTFVSGLQEPLGFVWQDQYENHPRDIITQPFIDRVATDNSLFIRGKELTWKLPPNSDSGPAFVWTAIAGPVRIYSTVWHSPFGRIDLSPCGVILARGVIHIQNVHNSIVISCEDVHVQNSPGCLVIARGQISCDNANYSHLISGKSVIIKQPSKTCRVAENELHPLGFIHWSNPPKGSIMPRNANTK